jgi:hypothetical protein
MKYAVTISHQGQSITVVVEASCQLKARQHARQALARAEITKVEIAPPTSLVARPTPGRSS